MYHVHLFIIILLSMIIKGMVFSELYTFTEAYFQRHVEFLIRCKLDSK